MHWILLAIATALLAASLLRYWRALDQRADEQAWQSLLTWAGRTNAVFDPAMVAGLPAPAQRYFGYMIEPGAPLHRAVEIEMSGELGLGTAESPAYRPMRARQLLAAPQGLVWKLSAGPVSGSDAACPSSSWTRFWLFDLLPIVRAGGTSDHRRSAFGRVVAESAIWLPASLLPGESVHWKPVDENRATAIVSHAGLSQAVTITVAGDGRPSRVVIQRWSNVNPEKAYREQPFGGDLSGFRRVAGYRLPMQVEGGNHIGTPAYFPFFKAEVDTIRFPGGATAP